MTILKFFVLMPLSFFLVVALEIDCFSSSFVGTDMPVLHAAPFSTILVGRQKKRFEASQMDKVCRALNIKKNMVILDIGTGSGQYAYKFAQTLHGTGEVFATDINPDMVHYVKIEAEKKHLKNLMPVLVKADGVDDFYSQHRYDLIFIAHALQYIPHHGNYLREMKEYLSPQGHLVILQYKSLGDFKPKDFTDVDGLLKQILKEQPGSPFYKYVGSLQSEARIILAGCTLNRAFLFRIARCFNKMTHDGHFFVPFLDKKDLALRKDLKISPQESVFINFNLIFFKEFHLQDAQRGVDLKNPHITWLNIANMRNINRILIISEFQKFMYGGKPPLLPGGNVGRQIESVKNEFKAYGYKLVQTYDFIPYEILIEFSAQD